MSLLATFYLLPEALGDEALAAARAHMQSAGRRGWRLFKPKAAPDPDAFLTFLATKARELEDLPYNGDVLVQVELLAPGVFGSGHLLGERLGAILGSDVMTCTPAMAAAWIARLDGGDFSAAAVAAMLAREGWTDDAAVQAAAIAAAVKHVKGWLRQVAPGEVGLLWIG